ncbi:MAG: hypothetical protein JSV63_01950 [Candidatus Aenigmatarchaeota archaeon]|nr:MAG: hypothetical protein JSV63_01950 [Candidatus Aenigmarchaeota archaeon]
MAKEFEEQVKKAVAKPMVDIPGAPKGASPPVFVKLDRFRDLLEDIQKLRSYSLGLRDAIDAMAEIEKEFKTAMGLTHKVLDKVNILISSIDAKLLQKTGPSSLLATIKPPEDVDKYVKGISDQIEKLKSE